MSKPTIALVTGCFDLLHFGHFKFLNFAKSQADTLVVAVESDAFLKKHKGTSRPLFTQKIRKYCLEQVKSIDQVISLSSHPDYVKLLQKIKPNFLVISSNDIYYKEKNQICQQLGVKLIIFPHLKGYSTTKIISSDTLESR